MDLANLSEYSLFRKTLNQKVLVLGAKGQVGRALLKLLDPNCTLGVSSQDINLAHPHEYLNLIESFRPEVIINAAAYTQVDLAEKEAELAWKINAQAPGEIAQWCADQKIPMIHFSTDYVFSGEKEETWMEDDIPKPINTYGKTKLEGENKIIQANGKHLIFRTSWVFDHQGKNFVTTMLKLGQEKETLKIVDDQWGAPTYAHDLAKNTLEALIQAQHLKSFPSGIYHLCNEGYTNWYTFAETTFEIAKKLCIPLRLKKLQAIPSAEYPTLAKRPNNSKLNCEKTKRTFGIHLPHWQDSLKTCLEIYSKEAQ